jgi:hypothetical protein
VSRRHWRFRLGEILASWLVPPAWREGGRALREGLRARRLVSSSRELLLPNAALRGAHAGRRCFVIGNGPSLARQNLAPLQDEVTLVTNGFWKHPLVGVWNPTYHFLADPIFFDGTEPNRRFFEELRTRCPRTTVFVPVEARAVVRAQGLLPEERVRWVAFSGKLADGLADVPDLTGAVPAVINVPLLAILTAMYAGCSPIYLLGLDHDWIAHRGRIGHFFKGSTIKNHPVANGADGREPPLRSLLESQLELWSSYEAIREVAAARGIQILNATDGGFLDVFPRASYEDVVGRAPASAERPTP